jgi:tRNA(Ile)-lysidine synthase
VRHFAERHKLPFHFGEASVKELAKQGRVSVEMAARTARHEFLATTARTQKIATIALAHHADDQVELFFLRLFRAGGGDALGGMKWRSPSPFNPHVMLVRPLLDCGKGELGEFADLNKIPFREDASNELVKIPRNKIRHELLPWLRKNYQPNLDRSILRSMDIIGAESEVLADLSNQWLAEPRPAFNHLPVATQRRVIQSELNKMQVPGDFDLIEQLRLRPNSPINVAGNLFIQRGSDGRLAEIKQSEIGFIDNQLVIALKNRQGQENFAGKRFTWKISARIPSASLIKRPNMEQFDAERVGGEICLRHWQAGDRFQPIGLRSSVKLQDLFTNAKVPRSKRHQRVVAASPGGLIFWVEGLRLGDEFKVTPETKWILNWRWAERPLK